MRFNYAYEKKKFEEEHRKMHDEYIAAGMSEEDYFQIYEWDWKLFNEERRYVTHTESYAVLFEGADTFEADNEFCPNDYIEWDSPIDQKQLRKVLRSLTKQQREILKLYTVDEMTQEMIALKLGISRRWTRDQLARIKKKFLKVFGK